MYIKNFLALNSKFIFFILLIFGLLFCSISLVNHYNYRTFAWDLGINNNAIYDYAHFRWNDCMVMQPQFKNVLADHFSLYPILISPLYWIFGSYTMLLFQIIMLLFGAYGVYRLAVLKLENVRLANLIAVQFFLIWGIYSALAFDYHDNVVGSMFVPWLFYFLYKRQYNFVYAALTALLISKENMALWAVFIGLGIFFLEFSNKELRKVGIAISFISGIYFIFIVKFIIPSIANEGREYLHFKYQALGSNMSEAIKTIINRPKDVFEILFTNHLKNTPEGDGIKTELFFMFLLSGGLLFFRKPALLIMMIPIFAQKLFSDDYGKWGLDNQYSIEFAPIISLALITYLERDIENKVKIFIATILLLTTFYFTFKSNDLAWRKSKWLRIENTRFYQKEHWNSSVDRVSIKEAMALIPKNASLSTMSYLVPHLTFRDYIVQYPDQINNVEYILVVKDQMPYPFDSIDQLNKSIEELQKSPKWRKLFDKNNILLFQKNQ